MKGAHVLMKRNILIFISFILISAGCIPYSDTPLTDQAVETPDASLFGTWFWNEASDHGFVHIGKDADNKTLLITMVEYRDDGRVDSTEFKGHTSRVGSLRFMNLKWTKPNESDKGYLLVKYEVSGDTLKCSFPSLTVLKKAVESSALKGEILSSGDVLIHASQEQLKKYIVKNEKTVYPDSSSLKKLALPKPNKPEQKATDH
jgi:hypothetical protein